MIGHLVARARAARQAESLAGFETFLREQQERIEKTCREFERGRVLREMDAAPFVRAEVELTEVRK